MIKKIISGGRTEADQAALDAAIKMGISHGGCIPRGRATETGTLPEKYHLQEMDTEDPVECIRRNVKESKGTLIIFHGKLTGDLYQAERETLKHKHQLLGIDLNQTIAFQAASLVNDWIQLRRIDVLYVIGPGAPAFPHIGKHTMLLIERTLILDLMNVPSDRAITDYSMKNYLEKLPVLPKTINEAVERLISELALKDKVIIANMTYGELVDLNSNLGAYIRNSFRLWYERSELMKSCRFVSKDKQLSADGASLAIINALWERLRKTHKLKVVK